MCSMIDKLEYYNHSRREAESGNMYLLSRKLPGDCQVTGLAQSSCTRPVAAEVGAHSLGKLGSKHTVGQLPQLP